MSYEDELNKNCLAPHLGGFDLDLKSLIEIAYDNYKGVLPNKKENVVQEVLDFTFERFRNYSAEKGISTKIFDAVSAIKSTNPFDFSRRMQALHEFQKTPEYESLVAINKRINNILKKSGVIFHPFPFSYPDSSLFIFTAEKELAQDMAEKEKYVALLIEEKNYYDALKILATLQEPIERFFKDVMIMDKDEKIRDNRLKLLNQLNGLFLKVADLSVL